MKFTTFSPFYRAHITHIANAFNTSASLFETLADVSAKFAKVADKEYEGTGAEVRKWFKKLAVCTYISQHSHLLSQPMAEGGEGT